MRGLERGPSEEVELRRQLRQGGLSRFNWPALEAHVLSMYGVGADMARRGRSPLHAGRFTTCCCLIIMIDHKDFEANYYSLL